MHMYICTISTSSWTLQIKLDTFHVSVITNGRTVSDTPSDCGKLQNYH